MRVTVESSTKKTEPTPDGLGVLGKAFGAPKDQQWYLRKQHSQRDGGRKNWPGRDYPEVLGPPEPVVDLKKEANICTLCEVNQPLDQSGNYHDMGGAVKQKCESGRFQSSEPNEANGPKEKNGTSTIEPGAILGTDQTDPVKG